MRAQAPQRANARSLALAVRSTKCVSRHELGVGSKGEARKAAHGVEAQAGPGQAPVRHGRQRVLGDAGPMENELQGVVGAG